MEMTRRAQRAIKALREPDASLSTVPNTVRQSIADVIEQHSAALDTYGIALMMIAHGGASPTDIAADALAKVQARTVQL